MRRIQTILIIMIFCLLIVPNYASAKDVVRLEGGILVDGRTLVPIRTVFESIGASVDWNPENKSAIVTKDGITIIMKIDEKQVHTNAFTFHLDVPPKLINGKTMVPIRFVSETLGAAVKWDEKNYQTTITTDAKDIIVAVKRPPKKVKITISAAGDVTLGGDEDYGYQGSFNQEEKKNGKAYFVKNIKDLFKEDDLTMVNLETTLTNATAKANKKFRFKADPSFTEILTLGNIESVNLANNHTFDYLEKGYSDTVVNLKKAGVGYFGFEHKYIKEVKGVKIGALGYKGWSDTKAVRKQIKSDIQSLRSKGVHIVVVHFHWGEERSYVPNKVQKSLGRYTIDNGADLVVGHHPHVVQGIEEYNDKFIVYSLGNFMFGGNRNPSDKDTFVFQQTFHFTDGKLQNKKEIKVIPYSISSVTNRNNFQPTPMKSANAQKLRQKLITISKKISQSDWTVYDTYSASKE